MPTLRIAGLDPSMSNWGLAKGLLDLDTGEFMIEEVGLQETSSNKLNKKTVRKNSDDLSRSRLLHTAMTEFIDDVAMVMVEIPVGSQSARAMASYGMCIGILAAVKKPLIQVTPNEVKIAATGNKVATKTDMINWATEEYPDAQWLTKKVKGVISFTAKNEHIADAIASIHAGVVTDEFKQAMAILTNT